MKLNSKGFAISTMLYGLLIVIILIVSLLMSTISFTRKSSKEFVEMVVDDLESKHEFYPNNTTIFNDYHNECMAIADTKVATCESNCDSIHTYELNNCCLDKCETNSNNCYLVCSKK